MMKKMFVLLFVIIMSLTTQVKAEADIYPDWNWNGVVWVYVGSGEPDDPPPTRIG